MLSKRQANAAADALLDAAREQRERNAARAAMFPELAIVPAAKRLAILQTAKNQAWREWPVSLLGGTVVLLATLWMMALLTDWERAPLLMWGAIGAAVAMGKVHKWQSRKRLRAMLGASE